MNHIGFQTWAEVLAHVESGKATYYHAPMDTTARLVRCKKVGLTVKVYPTGDCDPFTADSTHLSRFKRIG